MVTSKDFTKGMNNLFKEFNKLNPLKKNGMLVKTR